MEASPPMNGNQLLYWLSHLGEGTWESFSKSIEQLAELQEQQEDFLHNLKARVRFGLSEIGSVDFFPEKRRRWQVIEPIFASFPESPKCTVLIGGRSPAMMERLSLAVHEAQCTIKEEARGALPDQVTVLGNPEALDVLATSIRIERSIDYAKELIPTFVPIEKYLASAPQGNIMIGWKYRYFDLHSCQWTPDRIPRTVCECISQYGRRMSFLQVTRTKTVKLPRREAIYAAAMLARISIVFYDSITKTLRVPMHAPLPDACARLACINSGKIGSISNGMVYYSPVQARVARLILTSVGQALD
jgi:hypothetical protein